jgi:hypothetical protein
MRFLCSSLMVCPEARVGCGGRGSKRDQKAHRDARDGCNRIKPNQTESNQLGGHKRGKRAQKIEPRMEANGREVKASQGESRPIKPTGIGCRGQMQLEKRLALTLSLSPRRGNGRSPRWANPGQSSLIKPNQTRNGGLNQAYAQKEPTQIICWRWFFVPTLARIRIINQIYAITRLDNYI